jgi:hypothetical protein
MRSIGDDHLIECILRSGDQLRVVRVQEDHIILVITEADRPPLGFEPLAKKGDRAQARMDMNRETARVLFNMLAVFLTTHAPNDPDSVV